MKHVSWLAGGIALSLFGSSACSDGGSPSGTGGAASGGETSSGGTPSAGGTPSSGGAPSVGGTSSGGDVGTGGVWPGNTDHWLDPTPPSPACDEIPLQTVGGTGSGGAGSGGAPGSGGAGSGGAGSGGAPGSGGAGSGGAPGSGGTSSGFSISSTEWAYCEALPATATCAGGVFGSGTSPALTWTAGPAGTASYAIVFKDIAILANIDPVANANIYNRGFHYVIWDIPASVTSLAANLATGHLPATVPGARQWSSLTEHGYFGPCPNFDRWTPETITDSYSFVLYALPVAAAVVPALADGENIIRELDEYFQSIALGVTEYRAISAARTPEEFVPPGGGEELPCPSEGTPPVGCLPGPTP